MSSCLIGPRGSALVQTDIQDPATGEALYVCAKVRPRWYWRMRSLQLFLGIVWRDAWAVDAWTRGRRGP